MKSLITIKECIGLALTLSLAGGGFVMLLTALTAIDTTSPVKKTVTIHELLRDQNPGQISYISFPITEHFHKQVVSHRKSVP